jgi:hypothetical protein
MDREELVYYEGYGTRPKSLRAHWVNCCLAPDTERILPFPFCSNISPDRQRRYTGSSTHFRFAPCAIP